MGVEALEQLTYPKSKPGSHHAMIVQCLIAISQTVAVLA